MPHKNKISACIHLLCVAFILSLGANSISAATLELVSVKTSPNLQILLKIDKTEKLAGLKVSLTYPDKTLLLKSATKTKATSSFMHVVNDKIPGKLIIVMASAKGISGSEIPLFKLDFTFAEPLGKIPSTLLDITTCQLMSENLEELACKTVPYKAKPQTTLP